MSFYNFLCIITVQISILRTSDEEDRKPWMVMSKSFDNINDINKEETSEKKKDGGNIFSRLFKFKTLHTPLMKKAKQKWKKKSSNRSSVADDEMPHEGGESSLASSMSMPDIACEFCDNGNCALKPQYSGCSVRQSPSPGTPADVVHILVESRHLSITAWSTVTGDHHRKYNGTSEQGTLWLKRGCPLLGDCKSIKTIGRVNV